MVTFPSGPASWLGSSGLRATALSEIGPPAGSLTRGEEVHEVNTPIATRMATNEQARINVFSEGINITVLILKQNVLAKWWLKSGRLCSDRVS